MKFHRGKSGPAGAGKFIGILANDCVMLRFEFRFVGRSRGDAGLCVAVESIARVERNGQRILAPGSGAPNELGSRHAKAIIRNRERMRIAEFC